MVPYKFYILLKKKKITSWSASLDLLLTSLWHPKWGFTVVFLSLQPLICHFSANSFCPCPVSWLPLSSPLPGAASPRCRITQHCSGHTLCSAVGFPQPPCLLLALRCHCSQGPAPPLPTDATSVSWGVGLEAVSVRSQAEPCSAKDRLFGGQVQNANFCCNRHGPELVCK